MKNIDGNARQPQANVSEIHVASFQSHHNRVGLSFSFFFSFFTSSLFYYGCVRSSPSYHYYYFCCNSSVFSRIGACAFYA